jgi:hypothetical protein
MSRPVRIDYAGAVYHVTSRGNEKKTVFNDDTDRLNFLNTASTSTLSNLRVMDDPDAL